MPFQNWSKYINPKKETVETIEWEPKDHEKRVLPMADETEQLLVHLRII